MADSIPPAVKPKKSFKTTVEEHPLIIVCTAMIVGFTGGIGCYKGLLEITNQETVIKGSYTLKTDEQKPTNPGAGVIQRYFALINAGNFEEAWLLLHRERRAEIQPTLPNWEAFSKAYATTVTQDNIKVELERRNESEEVYWVSLDAKDSLPLCSFFEYRDRLARELFDNGVMSRAKTLEVVQKDLDTYFELNDDRMQEVGKLVEVTRVESLFSPLFVSEVGRRLGLKPKANFAETTKRNVWRHFIFEISLMQDGGEWKIRRGLYPPEAVGTYETGAKVPSR